MVSQNKVGLQVRIGNIQIGRPRGKRERGPLKRVALFFWLRRLDIR